MPEPCRPLIWWTSEADCRRIGEELPPDFPEYLRDEYDSRYGRNGRGCLWVAEQFGDVSIPEDAPGWGGDIGQHIEWASCAGIVIKTTDCPYAVLTGAGFVTNLDLEIVDHKGDEMT